MKRPKLIASLLTVCLLLLSITAVSALTYRVQWGDTLFGIARRFGTSVDAIVQANDIPNPNLIFAGQELDIPETGDNPTPTPPTPAPPTPTPPPSGDGTYIVKAGDTLYGIARRFNTTVSAIAQANGISNINFIRVGQRLIIPGTGSPPPSPADFELGGQSVNLDNQARMEQAGMNWVKIQYKWPEDTAGSVAADIETAHDNGFKILLTISGATPYPAANSIDFLSYLDFVKGAAAAGPDGIEVWNEMNIDFEWPAGQISPASYVNNMLAPAYTAIKAIDPSIMVISGALAPTGFDDGVHAWSDSRYLAGLRAAGVTRYMDCIGMHYNAGATSPNRVSGHPADPGDRHYSWYFRPTLDLYTNTFGGTWKVCITELGYLTPEGLGGVPPGFGWASQTTLAQQAQWLAEAAGIAANSGRVRLVVVYNVDFIKYDLQGDPQAGYAMVRLDGTCAACDTLGEVMNGR